MIVSPCAAMLCGLPAANEDPPELVADSLPQLLVSDDPEAGEDDGVADAREEVRGDHQPAGVWIFRVEAVPDL